MTRDERFNKLHKPEERYLLTGAPDEKHTGGEQYAGFTLLTFTSRETGETVFALAQPDGRIVRYLQVVGLSTLPGMMYGSLPEDHEESGKES